MKRLSCNTFVYWAAIWLVSTPAAGVRAQAPRSADEQTSRAAQMAVSLEGWSYDRVYEGWYADSVLHQRIYGPRGDEIGNVKNLLMNSSGDIVALIAEVGGFWDIGDTHVTIPWREIERRDGKTYSPITAETAEKYGMFADEFFKADDVGHLGAVDEFFETGPYIWKASALLDDYVVLEDGEAFGYVTDLVFSDGGKLVAVVVAETSGGLDERGVFALPWDRRGWRPGFDHYTLRYTKDELARLPKIDYSEFGLGS